MWQESKSVSATLIKPVEAGLVAAGGLTGGAAVAGGVYGGVAVGGTAAAGAGATAGGAAVAPVAVPVAAGAVALAAGAAIGQGIHWLIHWGWDPVNPLYPRHKAMEFTGIHDLEIDTLLLSAPLSLPHAHTIVAVNDTHPELGTLLLAFVRLGARTFIDGAQGVAAATVKAKAELKAAAAALKQDLVSYAKATNELADAIDHYRDFEPALPKRSLSLAEFNTFLHLSRARSLSPLMDYEGAAIQRLFDLAQVRSRQDIRGEIYAWLDAGIGKLELETFREAKYQTLTFAEVLRIHSKCLSLVNLSQSPLLK